MALEVADDMALGRRMKEVGGKSDALVALEQISVRWHPGAWATVRGLQKNGFAGLHYSLSLMVLATLALALIFIQRFALGKLRRGFSLYDDQKRQRFRFPDRDEDAMRQWLESDDEDPPAQPP